MRWRSEQAQFSMQMICFWSWPRIFITIRASLGLPRLWAALQYPAVPPLLSLWGSFHACLWGHMCTWGIFPHRLESWGSSAFNSVPTFLFYPHLIPLAECWQEPDERIPLFFHTGHQHRCVFFSLFFNSMNEKRCADQLPQKPIKLLLF